MSHVADSLRRALAQALGYIEADADRDRFRVTVPPEIDVRAIRGRLGMSAEEFAAQFGFSVAILEQWEQGQREPEGPVRAYLLVIDRAPKAVQKALRAG